MKKPCVYMLASGKRKAVYVGSSRNLVHRTWIHKLKVMPSFTKTYDITTLVWYEFHESYSEALRVE